MLKELNSSELIIANGGQGLQPGGRHTTSENAGKEDADAILGLGVGGIGGAVMTFVRRGIRGRRRGRNKRNVSRGGGGGSDIRIKTDIERLDTHPELGVDIYAWTYKNDDATRYVGVMAQDLLASKEYAHLVRVAETGQFKGFYEVDYTGLGIQMNTQAAWNAEGLDSLRVPMVA